MLKNLALLTLCALSPIFAHKSYEGYQVLRTDPLTKEAAEFLDKIRKSGNTFDFWTEPRTGYPTDIMTSPEKLEKLLGVLETLGLQHTVYVHDVQELIKAEKPTQKNLGRNPDARYTLTWDDYYRLDDIYEFIEEIAASLGSDARTIKVGQTYEGRDIMALEITRAGQGAPVAYIEAGIHAREWIASSVGTYFIKELVENPLNTRYLDNINFYFVPMANPDGFEYSHTDDRMWRKNRMENYLFLPDGTEICNGTDLNRNWDMHWNEEGTSENRCSDIYSGTGPFSENETKNISDYWLGISSFHGKNPDLSLCLHSYGQLMLVPYGYTANPPLPPNYVDTFDLALRANDALFAVHGTVFTVENSAELYPASGAADDWYKFSGSEYAYTWELRPLSNLGGGFVLPPEEIIPCGEEMWAALEVVLEEISI